MSSSARDSAWPKLGLSASSMNFFATGIPSQRKAATPFFPAMNTVTLRPAASSSRNVFRPSRMRFELKPPQRPRLLVTTNSRVRFGSWTSRRRGKEERSATREATSPIIVRRRFA